LEAFEARSARQAAAVALRLAEGSGSEAGMFQSNVQTRRLIGSFPVLEVIELCNVVLDVIYYLLLCI
jgi:hypothetical protein